MPIEDKVERYSVYITQNNYLSHLRSIRLSLESGGSKNARAPHRCGGPGRAA